MTSLMELHSHLPSHWKLVPLRYIAELGTGHTPDRTKPDYWVDCDIPWVTAADLSGRASEFEPLLETAQHVSALGVANSAAVVHPAGTVMFCRTASVGLLTITGRPMATTQAFVTWSPGPRLLSRYLLYALAAMRPELFRIAYGSTHLTIYMPDLEALRVPLPPLEEQRRIADFLDDQVARLDCAIGLRQKQGELLTHALGSAAERLLIGDGVAGQDPVPLRRLVRSIKTGATPNAEQQWAWMEGENAGHGIPWLSPASISGSTLSLGPAARYIDRQAAALFPRFAANSTLVVGIGATAGRVAHLNEEATGNQQLTCLEPSEAVIPRFLTWSLWCRQATIRATAPFTTLPIINNEILRGLEILHPSREDQERTVGQLDELAHHVQLARRHMKRWVGVAEERKQALITAAVTGQLDVTTAQAVAS